jgi:hypothetical protein
MNEQPPLYAADLEPSQVARPATLAGMYLIYGATPGKVCGDCISFFWVQYARRYFKCRRAHQTAGPGTDWRVKWPACGQWQARA